MRKTLGLPSGPIRPSFAMPKAPRSPRSAKYPGSHVTRNVTSVPDACPQELAGSTPVGAEVPGSTPRSASDSGAALISLEDLPEADAEIADEVGVLSLDACPLLMLMVDALVEVGWTRSTVALLAWSG